MNNWLLAPFRHPHATPFGELALILTLIAGVQLLVLLVSYQIVSRVPRITEVRRRKVKEALFKLIPSMCKTYLTAVAVAFFAAALGILAGNSRTGVVDAVLAGAVTVYGGLSAVWFAKGGREHRLETAICLIVFSYSLVYAITVASDSRRQWEASERHYQEELMRYETTLRIEEARVKNELGVGSSPEERSPGGLGN